MDKNFSEIWSQAREKIPASGWILCGEIVSLLRQIASFVLTPQQRLEFHQKQFGRFVFSLLQAEGNTLTEDQIFLRICGKLQLPESQQYLGRQADVLVSVFSNNKDNYARASGEGLALYLYRQSVALYQEFERSLALSVGSEAEGIFASEEQHRQWKEFLEWFAPQMANAADDFIFQTILLYFAFQMIRPFKKYNHLISGAILRFAAVYSAKDVMMANALMHHFYMTQIERNQYFVSGEKENVFGQFCVYAARGLRDGLQVTSDALRDMQKNMLWNQYIRDHFTGQVSSSARRQKLLVTELTRKTEALTREEILYLSPQIVELYAAKHSRTLMRDLKDLEDQGLIVREGKRYRAGRERVLGSGNATM